MRRREQGSLDGLCGVYAIVNSMGSVGGKKVTVEIQREIFRALAKNLNSDGKLHDLMVEGINFRTLGKLLDVAIAMIHEQTGGLIERTVACRTGKTTLDDFWLLLEQQIASNNAGSCILGLGGKHEHWTCVKAITEKSIRLIDSDGLKAIQRSRATVGAVNSSRQHKLFPTQTYFLKLVPD